MRKIVLIFFLSIFVTRLFSQVTDTASGGLPTTTAEQQLENITENNEDIETEDDSYLQQMVQFQKDPININTADDVLLKELIALTPLQIQNLISYRVVLGKLISIYELQAIPGWNLRTIQRVLPYITVGSQVNVIAAMGERLTGGDHSLLVRVSRTIEKSRGYLLDSSNSSSFYPGSPQKILVRYKYVYKNLLQYGLVAEKDAGEEFFKGSQKARGFDYYSVHFFIRNLGIVKSLALGDFTVNMGQGLTQWQSLAFKKGPDILATKRQSAVLRPYNSAGEINFHRGVGITVGKNNWEATIFGSLRNLDANFSSDSSLDDDDFITSLQTSGYHRTKNELDDRGVQRQLAFGGNVAFRFDQLHVGINAIQYQLKYPLIKDPQPYNLYALTGKNFGNYSFDYSYTYKNLHLFGEAASSNKKELAFVNGLMLSVSNRVDMSFFYRNISKGYQSLYTNAFTESTYPTNERGFFAGITMRPTIQWQIDSYADIYKFPWLKFRVNAPSTGSDYFIQVTYKPSKILEVYSRYKRESKGINYNPDGLVLNPVIYQPKKDWRIQVSYKVSPQFTLRSRTELVWFDKTGRAQEEGFLIYGDVIYRPMLKPFSGNIRLQYFETDGYNSRLYAYESDVLYSFSIPVFYDKGYRYYLNFNYDLGKKITVWARWAQTLYPDKDVSGSGLDEVDQNRRSEAKLQILYKF